MRSIRTVLAPYTRVATALIVRNGDSREIKFLPVIKSILVRALRRIMYQGVIILVFFFFLYYLSAEATRDVRVLKTLAVRNA